MPDHAELVALLEAHLAELNTQLALTAMALAAFGIADVALPAPLADEESW